MYVCLLVSTLSFANEGSAGSFSLSKTKVILGSNGSAETIRLRNLENNEMQIQVTTLPWGKKKGEIDPAHQVMAIPPVFKLPASGEQVIRLAARDSIDKSVEEAFVLVIEELPNEVADDTSGLSFALKMRLPIFVTPSSAKPAAIWNVRSLATGGAEIVLSNDGSAHIDTRSISIVDSSNDEELFSTFEGKYTLPGKETIWPFNVDLIDIAGPLLIKAETQRGPIEAVVSLPRD